MQGDRYIGLDGLRGVAAILVVLFHARLLAFHGYLAVDLFFIMSGVVIARSYEEALSSGAMSLRDYVGIRLARLYPMLFLGALVGLGFCLAGRSMYVPRSHGELARAALSQLTLIPLLAGTAALFPLNGTQWSIVWELVTNFAHAAGMRRLGTRALLLVVAGCAAVLAVYAVRAHTLAMGPDRGGIIPGLARAMYGFFSGVLMFRTREVWQPRVPVVHFSIPALAFATLAMMRPQLVPPGPAFGIYDVCVISMVLVPLAMLAARAQGGVGAHSLGTASYPLYAFHQPVIFWLFFFVGASRIEMGAAIVALVVLAYALGRWVDVPLNDWRRSRYRRRRAQALQTARSGATEAMAGGVSQPR